MTESIQRQGESTELTAKAVDFLKANRAGFTFDTDGGKKVNIVSANEDVDIRLLNQDGDNLEKLEIGPDGIILVSIQTGDNSQFDTSVKFTVDGGVVKNADESVSGIATKLLPSVLELKEKAISTLNKSIK